MEDEREICSHKGNTDELGNCHDCFNTGYIGLDPMEKRKVPYFLLEVTVTHKTRFPLKAERLDDKAIKCLEAEIKRCYPNMIDWSYDLIEDEDAR